MYLPSIGLLSNNKIFYKCDLIFLPQWINFEVDLDYFDYYDFFVISNFLFISRGGNQNHYAPKGNKPFFAVPPFFPWCTFLLTTNP